MLLNYMQVLFSNFKSHLSVSIVKILSLTFGLASAVLVIMHYQFATSSNAHIENSANTYRLLTHMKIRAINLPFKTAFTTDIHATLLRNDFGDQIPYISRIMYGRAVFGRDNQLSENRMTWAEPDALHIFDFDFISGSRDDALTEPYSVVLSESAALKYFANEDPMGKTLVMGEETDLRVTGVIKDQPDYATHSMDIIVSQDTGIQIYGENFMSATSWLNYGGTETFLALNPNTNPAWFSDNMPAFIERHIPDDFRTMAGELDYGLSLQPVRDIFLNPYDNFATPDNNSRKITLYGLAVFAALILATSCINYVNLSFSQAGQRLREIGIRKTLGATTDQIFTQFILESMVLTVIALLAALPILAVAIPIYTNLTSTTFEFGDLLNPLPALTIIVSAIITSLLAGVLPALVLSRITPAQALKGEGGRNQSSGLVRKLVTASQFTISTALILLAIATYSQIAYLQNMDIGFDKEGLIIADSRFDSGSITDESFDAFLAELARHPAIESVAMANFLAPDAPSLYQWRLVNGDPNSTLSIVYGVVGASFVDTWGLELIAGRNFSEDFPADFLPRSRDRTEDAIYSVIISDVTAKRLGFLSNEESLGEVMIMGGVRYRIVGVVKRFQLTSGMESDQNSVGVLIPTRRPQRGMHIRVDKLQTEAALAHIDAVWAEHRGSTPINRYFFSQSLNDKLAEQNNGMSKASLGAAIITMIISAFGLFTFAFYSTSKRTKEIGVRKVLGARVNGIVTLLVWGFTKPVLIASLVAWPIAWYAIDFLLQNFEAKLSFPLLWYLAVTVVMTVFSAIIVAAQSFQAAKADPVKCLRAD